MLIQALPRAEADSHQKKKDSKMAASMNSQWVFTF